MLLGISDAAGAADVAGTRAVIDRGLDAQYSQIEALYKDIHSHPELAFQETRTAALLAAQMRALGFEVTEHVGKTGIVALYRNGPGPMVMVRTELDALPVEEKTGLPWASTAKQVWRGPRDLRRACLRPRHPHGRLGGNCEGAAVDEGQVAVAP